MYLPKGQFNTLPEVVQQHAMSRGEDLFLYDQTTQTPLQLSFKDMYEHMNLHASVLCSHKISKGDLVAILAPNGSFFLHNFLGIQRAGGIPVTLYAPVTTHRIDEYKKQLIALLNLAQVKGLIIAREFFDDGLAPTISEVPSLSFVLTEEDFNCNFMDNLPPINTDGESLALIQFTSGTTSFKRGVMVRHRNMLNNVQALALSTGMKPDERMVSWLPLAHDMGLVGATMTSLVYGFPLLLMTPFRFVVKPVSWLQAITNFRGTITYAPNFGFQRCVNKIKESDLKNLNLSSLRITICGAEPVLKATVDSFCSRFAPYGFRKEAFFPGYGLAEYTLAVSLKPPGEDVTYDEIDYELLSTKAKAVKATSSSHTITVCSVGHIVPGAEVKIVDESGRQVPDNTVGEIIVRGESVAAGYYRNEELTEKTFRNGWLYTGDHGYLSDNQLYITGRKKDLIIYSGRNYYPQDLEQALLEVDGIRPGCIAALSMTSESEGTERIVVVAEVKPSAKDHPSIVKICHQKIRDRLGISVDEIFLAPPHFIQQTTSGKISRTHTKNEYLKLKGKEV
jgi:acyl-CoA synthetase (AMP-forming)/AMP-acid ligase II